MKTHIARTVTLAASLGIIAIAPASAQQNPARRPTQPPAAATAKAAPATGAARIAPTPTPAARQNPAAEKATQEAATRLRQEMDAIMAAWEKRSGQLKTLNVGFTRVDRSSAWEEEKFTGQAFFQSPDLACLHFKKQADPTTEGTPAQYKDYERIVCTGSEVLRYTWDTKQMFVYPLDKSVQQKTLQQGPLPFLFNLKADAARKRYDMALTQQSDKQYLIRIAPLYDIDRESFSKAFLWLNKTTFLPDQLWLVATNGKDYQDYKFTNVVANQTANPQVFQKILLPGFKEVDNDDKASSPAPVSPARKAAAHPGPSQATRSASQPR